MPIVLLFVEVQISMWPKSVVYSFVVGDLFHYGHLQLLQAAKKFGELHVCGVLTDEAAISYRSRPIANFEERSSVISCLRCVDQVVPQSMLDPTENLQKLHATYPHAQFILVHVLIIRILLNQFTDIHLSSFKSVRTQIYCLIFRLLL